MNSFKQIGLLRIIFASVLAFLLLGCEDSNGFENEENLSFFEVRLETWLPQMERSTKTDDRGNEFIILKDQALENLKDPRVVFQVTKNLASQGNSYAMATLGLMHQTGFGTSVNLEEAVFWVEQAKKSGNFFAEFLVESKFLNQIKFDYPLLMEGYFKAANGGNLAAIEALCINYANIPGSLFRVTRTPNVHRLPKKRTNNKKMATPWCLKLAEAGNIEAYKTLGAIELLEKEQNPTEIIKWFYLYFKFKGELDEFLPFVQDDDKTFSKEEIDEGVKRANNFIKNLNEK